MFLFDLRSKVKGWTALESILVSVLPLMRLSALPPFHRVDRTWTGNGTRIAEVFLNSNSPRYSRASCPWWGSRRSASSRRAACRCKSTPPCSSCNPCQAGWNIFKTFFAFCTQPCCLLFDGANCVIFTHLKILQSGCERTISCSIVLLQWLSAAGGRK